MLREQDKMCSLFNLKDIINFSMVGKNSIDPC